MASDVRVEINSSGATDLLTGDAVLGDLMSRGKRISRSACSKASPDDMDNDPFVAVDDSTGSRARVRVIAATPHGIYNDKKYNTLLKSIDAGR